MRGENNPNTCRVIFDRPANKSKGYITVPTDDLATAHRLVEPLLANVPDDAIWSTDPYTPGILPDDKETATA